MTLRRTVTMSGNGYSSKTLKTSLGEVPIRVPRDRQSTFEPQIIKKHPARCFVHRGQGTGDVCPWHEPTRHRCPTIEDIYGFQMSYEQISTITGCVMEEVEAWRNRPLSRSIHLLSSTASTYRCARVWRPAGGVLRRVLAHDASTAARMSLASGSTRRRASAPGCRSSTSCGLWGR